MTAVAAAAAATASLTLAGCGDDSGDTDAIASRTVDTAQVAKGIEQELSTSSADVTSVKCPDDVAAEAGANFTCSVSWSTGASGKVKVTQEAPNRFTYAPVSGSVRVPGSTVEASIEEDLAKQGAPDVQADCPESLTVRVGTTTTCDLSAASGQTAGTVTFTFSDASGTVDPSSVQTG